MNYASRPLHSTQNATESLAYGTRIVGGVSPNKSGSHLDLPLFPTVREVLLQKLHRIARTDAIEAKANLNPDATAVYVASHQAASAIEEAIEAEVPLIVSVAEHIPTLDLIRIAKKLKIASVLKTQSKSRLVGPNSPGIISATGRCRIGFHPLPFFQPGDVGIVAKSGTLSYETVASLTRAGLGQSLVIGVGGDVLPGTDFVDALKFFEHHNETKAIILVGEIGGYAEERAAEWIDEYRKRDPKPIAALIAGIKAPPDHLMGHAGAYSSSKHSAFGKVKALEDAGVTVVNHPSKFGEAMKQLLGSSRGSTTQTPRPSFGSLTQKRHLHTQPRQQIMQSSWNPNFCQRRTIFLTASQGFETLRQYNIPRRHPSTLKSKTDITVTMAIDRRNDSLCMEIDSDDIPEVEKTRKHPVEVSNLQDWYKPRYGLKFKRKEQLGQHPINMALLSYCPELPFSSDDEKIRFMSTLVRCFVDEEAFYIRVRFQDPRSTAGVFRALKASIGIDGPIYKGNSATDSQQGLTEEQRAAEDGIVYIKLPKNGNIGTLVNGAGLAMNTVDALADQGGKCSNFLDTGGKATAETVKASFALILKDPNVKVVFVNIFGGLTRCDMIAEGIILAYREMEIRVPVVVRLRGTNEGEGQKLIAESRLELLIYDDFEEAAAKCIELANGGSKKPAAENRKPN
ncbi:MAG: hypothetical protein Q9214_002217 [Letrouitia sp. 1 TL-2023]